MSENTKPHHPVLDLSWKRFAQLDANSMSKRDAHIFMRRWIAILGVLATLLAILVNNFSPTAPSWLATTLKVLLILTPITTSIIAAFANKFQQGQKYLAMRAAAQEILKEIYLYRTVLRNSPARHKWLSDRLADIQRDLYKAVGGELVLEPYKGNVPPYYDPAAGYGDPGFGDINGEQYLAYRLEDQLAWHIKKNIQSQRERMRIQWLILAFGGAGAFLAAMGGGFAVWVALTASLVSAYVGWEELRGLDMQVSNFSRVVLELNIVRDAWMALNEEEKTEDAFFELVRSTENLVWSQHSEFIKSMQDTLAEMEGTEAGLVEQMVQKSQEASAAMQEKLYAEAQGVVEVAVDQVVDRVALAVEDSAAAVKGMITNTAGEVEDGFEVEADEIFEDEVLDDAESIAIASTVDAALAESLVVASAAEETFEDEDFADEASDVKDFEDESFEDTAEAVVDETFEDEVFDEEEFVDEVFG